MTQAKGKSKVEYGVKTTELGNWYDFIEFIKNKHSNSPGLIYRGQAHADWPLNSTLARKIIEFPKKRNFDPSGNPVSFDRPPLTPEQQLEGFCMAARALRGTSTGNEQNSEKLWMLGQQHGLATPLLDWTWSPFVALYFAFEEKHCLFQKTNQTTTEWSEPPKRAVWVFTLTISIVEELGLKVIVPRGDEGYRFANQGSVFLEMPIDKDLESTVREYFQSKCGGVEQVLWEQRKYLEKIVIPNEDRIDCLKFLNKMNINRMSLFPDLDGAAAFINKLWELNGDWPLLFTPEYQTQVHEGAARAISGLQKHLQQNRSKE